MKVVEPSEILVGEERFRRGDPAHVNPWMRLLARFFDYSLFSLLFPVPLLFAGKIAFWIPVEALLLVLWGKTPGKALLNVRLKGEKFTFLRALQRSVLVWFRGLGMGIPGVSIITLLVAYQRLNLFRKTSWDRELNVSVEHAPVDGWRIAVAIFVIFFSGERFFSGG